MTRPELVTCLYARHTGATHTLATSPLPAVDFSPRATRGLQPLYWDTPLYDVVSVQCTDAPRLNSDTELKLHRTRPSTEETRSAHVAIVVRPSYARKFADVTSVKFVMMDKLKLLSQSSNTK